jgi:predicted DNA binding CopG/RHH family protein
MQEIYFAYMNEVVERAVSFQWDEGMTNKMKKLKPIPSFANEDEEHAFWETHDSTGFINWNQSVPMTFPNLKPSTKTISIRLPESLIDSLKVLAHKQDVGYQSLIKMLLSEHVARELAPPGNAK